MFGLYNLEVFSASHKYGVLSQNLILEFFQILQLFSFLHPLLCLSLSDFSCLLYSSLNIASFCCLFQVGLKSLLLFILLLHLLVLLFKYFSISLRNIRRWRKRHDDIGKKQKFSSCLCIIDLDTITDSLDKLNRTLKAQF